MASGTEATNVLLVDDSPADLLAVGEALSGLGLNVVKAASGLEALRLLLDQTFAVVVLDVRMPGMDGFEVAKFMRQLERTRHTPIVFLSGSYVDDASQLKGYLTGAADYLLKPATPEILRSKIQVFVNLARKEDLAKREIRLRAAIPLDLGAPSAKVKDLTRQPEATAPISILLVDDNPNDLKAVEETLSNLQVNMVKATSGKEALRHLLTETFAVVILDVRMPGIDGFEVARSMQKLERTRYTPIVFLSGAYREETDRLKGYSTGGTDYLLKPAAPEILRSKIQVFVNLARKEELAKREIELEAAANRRLTELNSFKDEFISTVSHELRTPLAITREGISLVLDGVPGEINEKQHKVLTTAQHNIDRLTRLINDLLDISKLEAGKVRLHRERVDLAELLTHVTSAFEPRARAKGLVVKAHVPQAGLAVYADADKITQVLTNLLSNALQFTTQGQIAMSASAHGDEIVCQVADTGQGISKEDLPKVFGKFEQFHRPQGSGGTSTGLGLAIAKGFIELHHGTIHVESELGKGATFTFALPVYHPQRALEESFKAMVESIKHNEPGTIGMIALDCERLVSRVPEGPPGNRLKRLEQAVQVVRRHVKTSDVVLGLEPQWIVMLAVTDVQGLHAMAGRIRDILGKWANTEGGVVDPAPLQVGMALYPIDGEDIHDLLAEARDAVHLMPDGVKQPVTGRRRRRILLADDDPALLQLMSLRLQAMGFEVLTASDGEKVLEQVMNKDSIDLLLIDIRMPKLDGLKVCQELKQRLPSHTRIPVIAMTAYGHELTQSLLELGITDVLNKPVRSTQLLQTLSRALGKGGPTDGRPRTDLARG